MMSTRQYDFQSGEEAIRFLLAQHRRIAHLFQQLNNAPERDWQQNFLALRRLLAAHEVTEEEVIHPRFAQSLQDGGVWAQARLAEESAIAETVTTLEGMTVVAPEFASTLADLRADVLRHAEIEEQHEYPRVAELLGPDDLRRLVAAAHLTQSLATASTEGEELLSTSEPAPRLSRAPYTAMTEFIRAGLAGTGNPVSSGRIVAPDKLPGSARLASSTARVTGDRS